MGSAAHCAHFRMFSGLALPAMVVVIAGLAMENWRAHLAISEPLSRQSRETFLAASLTLSGSLSQAGRGASVRRRAENGPAFRLQRLCFGGKEPFRP